MSCDWTKNKLEAYVLGLLSEPEVAQVREHMQTCEDCRCRVETLKNVAHLIEKGFNQAPPVYMRSKVLATLKDRRPAKLNWLAWMTPALIGAAIIALVIKIEPDRMLKEQALPVAQEEVSHAESEVALSVPKPAAGSSKSRLQSSMARKKNRMAATPVTAQPASVSPERLERKVLPAMVSTRALAIESEADEEKQMSTPAALEAVVEQKSKLIFSQNQSLPAKREATKALGVGSGQVMDTVASMHFAEHASRASASMGGMVDKTSKAEARPATKISSCVVTLIGTEKHSPAGSLQSEIEQLTLQIKPHILQAGNPGIFLIKISLDARGQVLTAEYTRQKFDSVDLNQTILDEIRTMHFSAPTDSSAIVTLEINVQ